MKKSLLILIFFSMALNSLAIEDSVLLSKLTDVLKDKCMQCHNAKKKKGKFDIEALITNPDSEEDWLNIHDVVIAGDMPPEDEPQLTSKEKVDLINHLPTFQSKDLSRLLTPAEINNTLMDFFKAKSNNFNAESLLKVNYDDQSFLTQQKEMISPFYINDLYQTLDNSISTLVHARELPEPITVKGLLQAQGHVSKTVNIIEKVNGKKVKSKGGDLRWRWKGGAPFGFQYPESDKNTLPPGIYEMSFDIQTPNYGKPIKEKSMATPYGFLKNGGKFEVAFTMGSKGVLGGSHIFKVIEVPVEKTRMTIKLDVSFPSKISARLMKGPSGGKFKYNIDKFYGKGAWKSDNYPLPCVRFTNVEITGPIGLAKADTTIYGDNLNSSEVEKRLALVQKNNHLEVDPDHLKSFEHFIEQGMSFEDAYRKSILMFFMSSKFLNLKFSDEYAEQARFSSYSLMKSPPSNEFVGPFKKFKESKNGKALAAWMIKHPLFDRFLYPFTSQWLNMDHLKNSPPGKGSFPVFYEQRLGQIFPEETMAFMSYMFKANRPIHELVTADYSFLNPTLHAFYKTGEDGKELNRKGVYQNFGEYEKYTFKNQDRGGILTQGTFLTVNSNGVEGLPIRRSVWILENILSRHVPEPSVSVDIEQFEMAKKMSFSERLEMHRNNPTCNNCHKKIDPFATLMNLYDTIGSAYDGHLVPEMSAKQLKKFKTKPERFGSGPVSKQKVSVDIDGKKLTSIKDMKSYLKTQQTRIAHAFLSNILKFTLGRSMEISDNKRIGKIIAANKKNGLRTADLYGSFLQEYFIK